MELILTMAGAVFLLVALLIAALRNNERWKTALSILLTGYLLLASTWL